MKSFACVVVLYHPTKDMFYNIKNYLGVFDFTYIVDNSEKSLIEFIDKLGSRNVQYIFFGENKGLAYALSYAAECAIREGYHFLMTFDQDSYVSSSTIKEMIDYMREKKVGIVAPNIIPYYSKKDLKEKIKLFNTGKEETEVEIQKFVITSGSLINLKIYQKVGGFNNSLFIECIDTDYCIKMYLHNYEIHKLKNLILYQRAGNSKEKKFLFMKIHPLFAAPSRGYYLFRNHICLWKQYGFLVFRFYKPLLLAFIKTILYEDNKKIRIYYYLQGLWDGIQGKLGALEK